MNRLSLLAAAALLAASPLANASTVVGSGHVAAGDLIGATTLFFGVSGIDGFELDVSSVLAGIVLTTATTDNSGLGFDLDLQFWDANFNDLGGCYDAGSEQSCTVPAGAVWLDVLASQGADLDVDVIA
jgi:hypothetical protein